MDDLLSVFIAETSQSLDEGEASFQAIQKAPGDHDAIDNLLRLMNSIRETSGFLGLPALNAMAVMAVDQLTQLRSSQGTDAWERIPAVKESLRVLRTLLSDLAERAGGADAAKSESKAKEAAPAKAPAAAETFADEDAAGDAVADEGRAEETEAEKPAAQESLAREAKAAKPAKEPKEPKPSRAKATRQAKPAPEESEEDSLPPAKAAKPAKAARSKPASAPAPEPVAEAPAPAAAVPEPVEAAAPAPAAPVQPQPAPAAAPQAPMAGAVVVQAQTLDTLLNTVNNLMAAQAEMIQLMRNLGVTMPRGGQQPRSSARPPSEAKILSNRPRVDNGAQPTADAATRAPASVNEETSVPNGNVVRLRDRRADSGTEAGDASAPLPPVMAQMRALEQAAETQLDEGSHLQLFVGAHGRVRTVDTAQVARVVEVDLQAIDSTRSLWMAEVDDLLVPLVPCDRDLALPEKGVVPIIVLSFDGQWLGLMTAEIGGTTRGPIDTSYADLHAGRAGLATVNGQDLEVIEPAYYLAEALRQRTRVSTRRAASKQKRSTAAAAAIVAEADDLFVRKPGH
jgi:chemotaxis protein histidine kinase CheA